MGLTNSQYRMVMSEYEKIQNENNRNRKEQIAKLHNAHPDIKEIDDQIAELALNSVRHSLLNKENTTSDTASKIDELEAAKKDLLFKYGYTPDIYETTYQCELCKDTGYVDSKPCKCFIQKAAKILYHNSNLESILQEENFGTLDKSFYSNDGPYDEITPLSPYENISRTINVFKTYIENFDNPDQFENFLLYGEPGVGKTFLTHCVAKELMDRNHSVIYLTSIQLFDILSAAKFKNDNSALSTYEYIKVCDLLIIDDLGTELSNTFTNSELYNIINLRNQTKKSTIISSNLSTKDFRDRYSERLFSRMVGYYTILRIIGIDIRKAKNNASRKGAN
ncbi:MAG: ATP-binding protein [Lachnospiraceae bacterium]|nr:ATP-binding protein [Lachnospiraceae bacterium]